MKKLFGGHKRPYQPYHEKDNDWEDEYSEEEYLEEYTDEEYLEEDADEAVYEEETVVYADEEDDVIYEDEYMEEDDILYVDEYAEDDDIFYEEEDYDDFYDRRPEERKKRAVGGLWNTLLHMNSMDRMVMTTGVLVLVLALVTGTVYLSASMLNEQVSSFGTIGSQLADIQVIGEAGLTAVADAELARLSAANAVEEDKEYDEAEYEKEVSVGINMTSIEKDLKVKFVNSKTNKLISNVPFSVEVKTADGKTEVWTDDDMDGIIYKQGITSGSYSVTMQALDDEKYADYILSTRSSKVEVKNKIEYKKVDVSDEIKTESEVNAAKEDTAQKDIVVESSLKDTVSWVDSTQSISYLEVKKSELKDPATTASLQSQFTRLTGTAAPIDTTETTEPSVSIQPTEASVEVGKTVELKVEETLGTLQDIKTEWESSDISVATVTDNGEVTGVSPGTVEITYKVEGTIVSDGDALDKTPWNKTASCKVTVTGVAPTNVTLNQTEVTLSPKLTYQLVATTTPAGSEVVWTTDNAEVATVDATTGLVTGVKEGKVVITATTTNGHTSQCTVTVVKLMTLDKTTATVGVGGESIVTAMVAASDDGKGTVRAFTGNDKVLTVSVKDKVVTLKGVSAGSAAITVSYTTALGVLDTMDCTVTVINVDGQLKNNDGELLYVKNADGTYTEAKVNDYYKYDVFYNKVSKYTGWNTLNNKVYFFDGNGKYVTGEQVIQGAKYNFASDGSLVIGNSTFGIDVSKWNGTIDWNAVKNSGVSYVIIRSGYRGSSVGALIEDPKFKANIKGATAAGLKVGVYFFSQATNNAEAVEEASMVLQQVKGYTISYPIFLDVEGSGGRADKIDSATRTAVIKTFCETIQSGGYTAGVYANKSWLENKMDASQLTKYKIWLAQYAKAPTYSKTRYDMWQYKDTGKVTGISGNVDFNISYLGY